MSTPNAFLTVAVWIACGGIHGWLIEHEKLHSQDLRWWIGSVLANSLPIAIIAFIIVRDRVKVSIVGLIGFQLILAVESFSIRLVGGYGLIFMYLLAIPLHKVMSKSSL